jgi:hypothetical protein
MLTSIDRARTGNVVLCPGGILGFVRGLGTPLQAMEAFARCLPVEAPAAIPAPVSAAPAPSTGALGACLTVSRTVVIVRVAHCVNALPLMHGDGVVVCWLAGQPEVQRATPLTTPDAHGSLKWDCELLLPLPPQRSSAPPTLVAELRLGTAAGHAFGVSHLVLADEVEGASTRGSLTWVRVVGTGAARPSDGECDGSAEMLLGADVVRDDVDDSPGDDATQQAGDEEAAAAGGAAAGRSSAGGGRRAGARDGHGFVVHGLDETRSARYSQYYRHAAAIRIAALATAEPRRCSAPCVEPRVPGWRRSGRSGTGCGSA